MQESKTAKGRSLAWIVVVGLVMAIALPPMVAYAVDKVKIQGTVKMADTSGDIIESKAVANMGLLSAPGSEGAVAVRTYGGGGGLLGTGDCTPDATTSRPNTVTVDAVDNVITALIITGPDAKVTVDAPDLDTLIGPAPVANFRTNAENPNFIATFGNGLSVTPSELVFVCTGGAADPNGQGDFVILGQ